MESVSKVSSTVQPIPVTRLKSAAKPRLSIVVTLDKTSAAFEETLLSVLENRPEASEILACHDGSYEDPFDLHDEVRFIDAGSSRLVDLVVAGATTADGRYVHVMASGLRATQGWADTAIEMFEHSDCGSIASVVRDDQSNKIIAAGWRDTADRLCNPNDAGKDSVTPSSSRGVGAHLQASFWRRDLLCSLSEAFQSTDVEEASVAYEYLARRAGWRCIVAEASQLTCVDKSAIIRKPSLSRGVCLSRLRNHFHRGGWSAAIQTSVIAAVANLVRPNVLAESIGQAFAATGPRSLNARIKSNAVVRREDREVILTMPVQQEREELRRTA